MLRPVPDPGDRDDGRSDCPLGVCEGNGWVLGEDDEATPCECRTRRVRKAQSQGINNRIPERFRGVGFDRNPIAQLDPMVTRHVRRFIDDLDANLDAGRGLWFYGAVGTGKPSVAMLVAHHALKRDASVAIYSIPRLFTELRATYDDNSRESFWGLFRKLCSVDLLVLDDLGAERQTDWVVEQLYSIVNERWQDRGSILVTSNILKDPSSRVVRQIRQEVDELRQVREQQGRTSEMATVIARLEVLAEQFVNLDANPRLDPLQTVRDQIGDRTVSRLLEISDDPIPIMGPDLRLVPAN